MAKSVYAADISKDEAIPAVIVRTSTISEELGRVHYLLSDKTGTLTKNDMQLKRLHLGTVSFGTDNRAEIAQSIQHQYQQRGAGVPASPTVVQPPAAARGAGLATMRAKRDISARLLDATLALALCHNVTPVEESDGSIAFQAASPDEVAIVKWTQSVGVTLSARDRHQMQLSVGGEQLHFDILHCFPFSSELKRMGIVVRERGTAELCFYQKGADAVMDRIVQGNDWLEEECANMAREGLRTLVFGRKRLTKDTFEAFQHALHSAQVSMHDRQRQVQAVVSRYLECDLELLALTGVEDRLQDDVKTTLESLRHAGIKIWMLTGDKVETATCVAISSRLFTRSHQIVTVQHLRDRAEAAGVLARLSNPAKTALVLDGPSLDYLAVHFGEEFWRLVLQLPAVAACRCTPTQKADVARAIQLISGGRRVCCIGDGGNDVSMIQAANVGVGIVGKEGKQASLAADFSVSQFAHLNRLLLWHGRNSYKRTCKVSQFVIHRGFVIAVMQAVFSALVYYSPIALYQGIIAVGYTTVYTMAPVFSLVLDRDVTAEIALLYPELYKDLIRGRELSFKTFFQWLLVSVYQGGAIMILAVVLFERDFIHVVSITFTALILSELLMIALEVTTWHPIMVCSELVSIVIYLVSMFVLRADFDRHFICSGRFAWKVALITAVSFAPLFVIRVVKRMVAPPSYAKLAE